MLNRHKSIDALMDGWMDGWIDRSIDAMAAMWRIMAWPARVAATCNSEAQASQQDTEQRHSTVVYLTYISIISNSTYMKKKKSRRTVPGSLPYVRLPTQSVGKTGLPKVRIERRRFLQSGRSLHE